MADAGGRVQEVTGRAIPGQVGAEDFSHGSFRGQAQVGRLRRGKAADQAEAGTVVSKFEGRAEFELVRAILRRRAHEGGGTAEIPCVGREMLVAAGIADETG